MHFDGYAASIDYIRHRVSAQKRSSRSCT